MDTTTNFSDIFKSSFLETNISFSVIDSLLGLGVAFLVGLIIYAVYKKTFNGVIYSHSFNISLIIMTMATALVIMGISQNVLLSLGMVGALSIVRFRTPIKDPMDLVFLFWSVIAGILSGAGFILLAIIGSVLIGLVIILFANKIKVENPYLLVVKLENNMIGEEIERIMKDKTKKFALKSKSIIQDSEVEVTYEIRVKENDTQIASEISNLQGVYSAVMLSYDGNFTA
ncbi:MULTISPECIES: DUF4956 domain-containing protein [Metabacillus]|jgi:uncharacterized membrane protein YhiD involved in acid resistance|uniref:DUF4956 domain-containing protein n=1 Tax=Metabacillus rhizolycopersici TaxID=2875709 RepID=A0ABS7UTH5_9BACI|nr:MULTISPECIES: DUF4956 domain-containing protein [Metabacillus]MBZ5751610.1 DUF4956 domain-containing protein [Metabacillus rhizolycopersici]MCM3650884.1 DUF4956 domain-containing protein [Metabacillus litoralis]